MPPPGVAKSYQTRSACTITASTCSSLCRMSSPVPAYERHARFVLWQACGRTQGTHRGLTTRALCFTLHRRGQTPAMSAAAALDAADGVIDGKYYGKPIVAVGHFAAKGYTAWCPTLALRKHKYYLDAVTCLTRPAPAAPLPAPPLIVPCARTFRLPGACTRATLAQSQCGAGVPVRVHKHMPVEQGQTRGMHAPYGANPVLQESPSGSGVPGDRITCQAANSGINSSSSSRCGGWRDGWQVLWQKYCCRKSVWPTLPCTLCYPHQKSWSSSKVPLYLPPIVSHNPPPVHAYIRTCPLSQRSVFDSCPQPYGWRGLLHTVVRICSCAYAYLSAIYANVVRFCMFCAVLNWGF